MERSVGPQTPSGATDAVAQGAPAVRDATDFLARAAADEGAADRARERYRAGSIAPITPDARVAPLLEAGEVVVAYRTSAELDRRERLPAPGSAGLAGKLYVTSRRLLLLGRVNLSIDLSDIDEVGLAGERLLIVLRDGKGVSIEAPWPRLLRVQIAAARTEARR